MSQLLRDLIKAATEFPLAFHRPHLYNEEDFYTLLGVTKPHFSFLSGFLVEMRNTPSRIVQKALAIFLLKLRHNMSQVV